MDKRLEKQIKELQNAIKNFTDSLSINCNQYDSIAQDAIKSGQVQKFEFCVELYWKTLKRYIQDTHGFDLKSPKATIKKGLIWIFMIIRPMRQQLG
ncbi:MAG: nucleotidyltransferase substrate binding protein [Spirochaetales bacterium]|nr:nucleotidyltransferase substrate binding protein [Spirochaetales bacterium]